MTLHTELKNTCIYLAKSYFTVTAHSSSESFCITLCGLSSPWQSVQQLKSTGNGALQHRRVKCCCSGWRTKVGTISTILLCFLIIFLIISMLNAPSQACQNSIYIKLNFRLVTRILFLQQRDVEEHFPEMSGIYDKQQYITVSWIYNQHSIICMHYIFFFKNFTRLHVNSHYINEGKK